MTLGVLLRRSRRRLAGAALHVVKPTCSFRVMEMLRAEPLNTPIIQSY